MTEHSQSSFSWGCAHRLAALREFDILDTKQEAAFDEITQLAAQFCHAPIAIVSFLEADRQWFKSEIGLGFNQTTLDESICAKTIHLSPLVVINDLANDQRLRENPFVTGKPHLRFYAGARLETADGFPLGAVCVCDFEPRHGLTDAQSSALLSLARAVMRELELRRSNKALAEKTALLNGALENVDQGIMMIDQSGDVVICNQRAIDLLGLPAEMMRSIPKFEEVKRWQIEQGEFIQSDLALVQAIRFEGNNIQASICERERPNGTVLEVRTNQLPNGGVVRTFADVTSKKAAKEKLQESEERYRLAAHATSDAIWDWDLATDRLNYENAEVVFGYAPGEIPGSGTRWLERVHNDDRARIDTKLQEFIAGQSGDRWEGKYRWKTGNGSYAHVSDCCYLVRNQSGTPTRLVGAMQDLSANRRANDALRESEERLRLALSATGLGIWEIDFATGYRTRSPEVRRIYGLSEAEEARLENFLTLVHPDDQERVAPKFYTSAHAGVASVADTFRIVRADNGEARWVELGGQTLYDDDGKPVRMVGTVQDITDRKVAEDALRSGEERLRLALHASNMVAWDLDMTTGHVNRTSNSLSLLGIGSGPTSDFMDRVHLDDQEKVNLLRLTALTDGTHTTEVRFRAPDGGEIWLAVRAERKSEKRLIGIAFDISDRKATEAAIWQTANHDPLTGLVNRALFQTHLEQALREAETSGSSVGLLLLDLDNFKDVNDTCGHAAGDRLLSETASRLTRLVGERDTVARVGGDEFAVILVGRSGLSDITARANAVVEALRATFHFDGRALSTQVSIGVAAFPEHHRDPVELMKDADIALYRAKELGRSRAAVYTTAARDTMERRVSVLREVRDGLAAAEFLPYYQPKVSLKTGYIVGFEALARWRHPSKGILSPGYFGSAFEDQEISAALATCVVEQVASDIRSWLDRGLACGRVAVNLSSADFTDRNLANRIIDILDSAGVPTSNFEVEITETVFLGRQTEDAASILDHFHKAGVSIALDDFGTGFASLTHLKQFPVDHIKIDQSFVRNLETDKNDAAIIAAVVGLGRTMGMHITAEGIETVGQAKRLREAGCEFGQGYLYAKPTPGSDIPELIRNWTSSEQFGLRPSPKRLLRA